MSYKSQKPEFVEFYAYEFPVAELKEVRAFYETPKGKASVLKDMCHNALPATDGSATRKVVGIWLPFLRGE